MDGTTSSSLYEARLGHEKFGKETHAYCVGFSDEDIAAVRGYASKVIFNSVSQLKRYHGQFKGIPVGLRVNPGVSHSHFDLADPARRQSRLGVVDPNAIADVMPLITGAMFHCQCENDSLETFSSLLDRIAANFAPLLKKLEWVSLGGGIAFTAPNYPVDAFCEKLSAFARRFDVQVYLEPGEAAVTRSSYLVTQVVDIVHNEIDVAIVDAAVEPHLLDLLIYQTPAKMDLPAGGLGQGPRYRYAVAGRTCLAGDVFGTYDFPEPLSVGSLVPFADAAGYSMVKKNWFNGVAMPSIVVRRLDGRTDVVRTFGYEEYRDALS
jgi:carboxynorspermidine decarboxylase